MKNLTIIFLAQDNAFEAVSATYGLIIILFTYILPSIIGRNKRNSTSITLINIFLGWTLIGWVAALIWAINDEDEFGKSRPVFKHPLSIKPPASMPLPFSQPGTKSVPEQLQLYKALLDDGAITLQEYDRQKQKLLNS